MLVGARQPLSVKFWPSRRGVMVGGTRDMMKGTPGQLTLPFPLTRMESPHRGSMSAAILMSCSSSLVKWLQSERITICGFATASLSRWRSVVSFEIMLNGVRVPSLGLRKSIRIVEAKSFEAH